MADVVHFPDTGIKNLVEVAVGKTSQSTWLLEPITADWTQAAGNTLAGLELISDNAAPHGISEATLTGSSWAASTVSGGKGSITFAKQTFTATSADDGTTTTVYGYAIYTGTVLIATIKFGASQAIVNTGDNISYTPEHTQILED